MDLDCAVFGVMAEFFKCLPILYDKYYYTDFVYFFYLILLHVSVVQISRRWAWIHKG